MIRAIESTRDLGTALRPLAEFAGRMLLILLICRSMFVVFQWPAVMDSGGMLAILRDGLSFDIAVANLLLLLPIACFPFLVSHRLLLPAWRGLLAVCLPATLLLVVFVECVTPSFVNPLDGRPGLVFLEYLNDPAGVASQLWTHSWLPILAVSLFALAAAWRLSRRIGALAQRVRPVAFAPALAAMLLMLVGCYFSLQLIAERVESQQTHVIARQDNIAVADGYNETPRLIASHRK